MNEMLDYIARYVWPVVLAWNLYLFKRQQDNRQAVFELRLHVAENYTSKQDLQKMFKDFESRLAERFSLFEKIIKK